MNCEDAGDEGAAPRGAGHASEHAEQEQRVRETEDQKPCKRSELADDQHWASAKCIRETAEDRPLNYQAD